MQCAIQSIDENMHQPSQMVSTIVLITAWRLPKSSTNNTFPYDDCVISFSSLRYTSGPIPVLKKV